MSDSRDPKKLAADISEKQMLGAYQRSIYIVPKAALSDMRRLANGCGRGDLQIVTEEALDNPAELEARKFPAIVVDHALTGITAARWGNLEAARKKAHD
jgi:hypothetical protein